MKLLFQLFHRFFNIDILLNALLLVLLVLNLMFFPSCLLSHFADAFHDFFHSSLILLIYLENSLFLLIAVRTFGGHCMSRLLRSVESVCFCWSLETGKFLAWWTSTNTFLGSINSWWDYAWCTSWPGKDELLFTDRDGIGQLRFHLCERIHLSLSQLPGGHCYWTKGNGSFVFQFTKMFVELVLKSLTWCTLTVVGTLLLPPIVILFQVVIGWPNYEFCKPRASHLFLVFSKSRNDISLWLGMTSSVLHSNYLWFELVRILL